MTLDCLSKEYNVRLIDCQPSDSVNVFGEISNVWNVTLQRDSIIVECTVYLPVGTLPTVGTVVETLVVDTLRGIQYDCDRWYTGEQARLLRQYTSATEDRLVWLLGKRLLAQMVEIVYDKQDAQYATAEVSN